MSKFLPLVTKNYIKSNLPLPLALPTYNYPFFYDDYIRRAKKPFILKASNLPKINDPFNHIFEKVNDEIPIFLL